MDKKGSKQTVKGGIRRYKMVQDGTRQENPQTVEISSKNPVTVGITGFFNGGEHGTRTHARLPLTVEIARLLKSWASLDGQMKRGVIRSPHILLPTYQ